jgi:protein-L-isoaspartate O-methyltransferase
MRRCYTGSLTGTRADSRILARAGELIVERDRHRPSGRLLRQAGMDASYVDLADPAHLEFEYMRWLRVVLRAARARAVLHIGGAACALPRALAAEDPTSRQEVCEVDGEVLAFARAHMGLRRVPGLRVRQVDGREWLERTPPGRYDAVVIDAFVAARVPRHLITSQALQAVGRIAPLVLINVVDDRAGHQVRTVAAAVAETYTRVWTLGARVGNTIVGGDPGRLDLALVASRAAADPASPRLTGPAELARRIAGTAPQRDPRDY